MWPSSWGLLRTVTGRGGFWGKGQWGALWTDRVGEVGHSLDVQQLLKDEVELLVCALPRAAAREDQEAKDELWARGQGQGPLHPSSIGLGSAGASARTVIINRPAFPKCTLRARRDYALPTHRFSPPSEQPHDVGMLSSFHRRGSWHGEFQGHSASSQWNRNLNPDLPAAPPSFSHCCPSEWEGS